jgi:hypothetical protein
MASLNYQEIHIDDLDSIQQQVLDIINCQAADRTGLFYIDRHLEQFLSISELRTNLQRLDLLDHVYSAGCYVIPPGTAPVIHRDSGIIKYSLNLPIRGCAGSRVCFYRSRSEPILLQSKTGVEYMSYNPTDCVLIDSIEMTKPHIISVQQPHAVITHSKDTRITLLLRLKTTVGNLF